MLSKYSVIGHIALKIDFISHRLVPQCNRKMEKNT